MGLFTGNVIEGAMVCPHWCSPWHFLCAILFTHTVLHIFCMIFKILLQISEQCDPVQEPPPPTPPPPPPQPCVFAQWSTWSACSATCGGGKQAETRGIATEPACGGAPCSGDVTKIQDCNIDPCPCEFYSVQHKNWMRGWSCTAQSAAPWVTSFTCSTEYITMNNFSSTVLAILFVLLLAACDGNRNGDTSSHWAFNL